MSLLTTSTLDRFNELSPDARFDQRRFRMNVIVSTSEPGFVENDWVGRSLAIGDDAQIMVVMPDPRCVMPTLAQEDLPRDNEVMRTLVRHNRLDAGGTMSPCAGVYAAVTSAGALHTGDDVSRCRAWGRRVAPLTGRRRARAAIRCPPLPPGPWHAAGGSGDRALAAAATPHLRRFSSGFLCPARAVHRWG